MVTRTINYACEFIIKIALLLLLTLSYSYADEGVIKITGWDVYADPANKNKTIGYRSFEEKYNVTIEFTPQSNLDAIIDAAESEHDYDIFIISNEGIQLLRTMKLVESLDLKQIPHYQSLNHNLRYSEWSMYKGHVYAVPWAWGPTGLLFNEDIIKDPVSWSVLWDPEYKGKISLWDDISMIWTTALYLGYDNVYSLTRSQLNHVKKKLLELNQNVYDYYTGEDEAFDLARSKKVIALNSWFDPSGRLREKGHNFKMLIPDEGAVGMFDSYLISQRTNHKEVAYQYINHQISPEIQKQMIDITGLSPANLETLTLLSQKQIKLLHLNEPDYFNKMILWDNMPRKDLYEKILTDIRNDFKKQAKH